MLQGFKDEVLCISPWLLINILSAWCKFWCLFLIVLVSCQSISSKDSAENDVDGGKSKPPKSDECLEHDFSSRRFLGHFGIMDTPPLKYPILLHVGQFLPDEINDGVKNDFKEWHEKMAQQPDFN